MKLYKTCFGVWFLLLNTVFKIHPHFAHFPFYMNNTMLHSTWTLGLFPVWRYYKQHSSEQSCIGLLVYLSTNFLWGIYYEENS